MQISSRLLLRAAIVITAALLLFGVLLSLSFTQQQASAIDSEWTAMHGYIQEYFDDQFVDDTGSGGIGESGFRESQASLKARLDNEGGVGDGDYLGEGDDAADAPVLIDNLMQFTDVIPATSFRCRWSGGGDGGNCLADASVTAVQELVDAHDAAGFSTDIIVYCGSGHTEAVTAGSFGVVAQTGLLGSDSDMSDGGPDTDPQVYAFDWGRNGWTDTVQSPTGANAIAAADTSAGGFSTPALPVESFACESEATDEEATACQANWVLSNPGGNIGNGNTNMAVIAGAGQTIDVRAGTVSSTIDGSGDNIVVPIDTLFGSGLSDVDPAKTTAVAGGTPMMSGIAATGLKMLGYDLVAKAFPNKGLAGYNTTLPEAQTSTGVSYTLDTISAYTAPAKVDTTAPVISTPTESNITDSSADISRTVTSGEPATSKIEYEVAGSGVWVTENDTVLNVNKTVTLSGLAASTTYNYRLTAYDAQANASSTETGSFTTAAPPCNNAKPTLNLATRFAYWASPADFNADPRRLTVRLRLTNAGTVSPDDDAANVQITSASNTNGAVLINTPYSFGNIAAGASADVDVLYTVPSGVTGFISNLSGSADDECGVSWPMP